MLLDVWRCAIPVSAAIVLVSSSALAEDPADDVVDPRRVALGAGGHVAFGTAPAIALGTRVSAEIATRGWSVGVEGRYDARRGRRRAHDPRRWLVRALPARKRAVGLRGGTRLACHRRRRGRE